MLPSDASAAKCARSSGDAARFEHALDVFRTQRAERDIDKARANRFEQRTGRARRKQDDHAGRRFLEKLQERVSRFVRREAHVTEQHDAILAAIGVQRELAHEIAGRDLFVV